MICPPDYVLLVRLMKDWKGKRREVSLRALEDDQPLNGDEVFDIETSVTAFFLDGPDDLSEGDFLERLKEHLFMASPDGRVLSIETEHICEGMREWSQTVEDLWLAAHQHGRTDLLDLSYLDVSLHNDLLNEFRLCHLTKNTLTEWLSDARRKDPRISVRQLAQRENLTELHQTLPPFFERIGYTITLRLFDLGRELSLKCGGTVIKGAEYLRPYQGSTLCVRKSLVTSVAKWSQQPNGGTPSENPPNKSKGRPHRLCCAKPAGFPL